MERFAVAVFALLGAWFLIWTAKSESLTRVIDLLRGTGPAPYAAVYDGTLTYAADNAGTEIPYVVYKDPQGTTFTKALSFSDSSECLTGNGDYPCPLIGDAIRRYFGAGPVEVSGYVVSEHVVVTGMRAK